MAKKKPFWMGNMELLGASQGSPQTAVAKKPKTKPTLAMPNARELGAAYGQYMPDLSYGPLPMTPDLSATPAPFNTGGAARAAIPGLRGDIRQQNAQNVEVGNWMSDVEKARQDYEGAQQRLQDSEPQYREDALARAYGRAPRPVGQPQVPQPPAPGNIAPAAGMRPEEIDAKGRLLGTIGNQNPSTESLRSRVKTIDGQQYLANGRPAYGSGGGMRMGDEVVGVGRQTSGFGTGGGMGSALMRGPGPQQSAPAPRPEIASRPMVYGVASTPDQFQKAWKSRQQSGKGLASVQDELRPSSTVARGPSPERLSELASRKAAVKENAIARRQGRRGALAKAFGAGGDEAPDQFEMALQQAAMTPGNPQAEAAGKALIELRRNKMADAAGRRTEELTKQGWNREDARSQANQEFEARQIESQQRFAEQQAQLGRVFQGEQAKFTVGAQKEMATEENSIRRQANELQAEANRLEQQGRQTEAEAKRTEGVQGMVMAEAQRIRQTALAAGDEMTPEEARRQAEQNIYAYFPKTQPQQTLQGAFASQQDQPGEIPASLREEARRREAAVAAATQQAQFNESWPNFVGRPDALTGYFEDWGRLFSGKPKYNAGRLSKTAPRPRY